MGAAAIDRQGRRMSRAARRVAEHETLMPIVVPDEVHEALFGIARRNGVSVDQLVAQVLARLATDLGAPR